MDRANAWKLGTAVGSALVAIGADAHILPDGKVKHAACIAGVLGTGVSAFFTYLPQMWPRQTVPAGLVPASALHPGDVLLYRAKGLYGRIIALKTWHPIAHTEVYVGNGQSVASRDGIGTGLYPLRQTELAMVCRPIPPIDLEAGMRWFESQPHRPYGWMDLLQFIGFDIETFGVVCSPYSTLFVRSFMPDPFNGEPAYKIAPFEFLLSNCFTVFTVTPAGELARHSPLEVAHV